MTDRLSTTQPTCLSAWTQPDDHNYPPYVNFTYQSDTVTVITRAPRQPDGSCGVTTSVVMPASAFAVLILEAAKAIFPSEPAPRRYVASLAELIDRLCIVQLKMIFISEHSEKYRAERDDIEHDIGLILAKLGRPFGVRELRAVSILMLANRFIWENESRARAGGNDQDKLLKLTHSINGIRNAAKNVLSDFEGGRKDHKIDCLAADLDPAFGNWGGLL